MKHLMNSNNEQVGEPRLVDKEWCEELDVESRVLEARLNLFVGFSKLSDQLAIDATDCVYFFRANVLDI